MKTTFYLCLFIISSLFSQPYPGMASAPSILEAVTIAQREFATCVRGETRGDADIDLSTFSADMVIVLAVYGGCERLNQCTGWEEFRVRHSGSDPAWFIGFAGGTEHKKVVIRVLRNRDIDVLLPARARMYTLDSRDHHQR